MKAVGRVAQLGDLYDSRLDKFISVSIFNDTLDPSSIITQENAETNMKFTMVNTFSEKFNQLDISASLKLSILSGLLSFEGSGKYFKETKTSAKSAMATFINSVSTQYERINIFTRPAKNIIDFDILENIPATHVVVGIQYGGNVFVSVEDTNVDSEVK